MMNLFKYAMMACCFAGVLKAQLIEVPEELKAPVTEEQKADGPIPDFSEKMKSMTQGELARNEAEFPKVSGVEQEAEKATVAANEAMKEGDEMSTVVEQFAKDHAIDYLKTPDRHEIAPPEIKVNPEDTVVHSDYSYVDLKEKNVAVFLQNVRVRNVDYALDCDDQLQIYFKPSDQSKKGEGKKEKKKRENKDVSKTPFDDANFDFDGVKKAVAYGNVFFKYRDKEEDKQYEGFAERITYNGETGEIIMTGGFPWLKIGNSKRQMKNKNGVIRMLDGKYFFNGPTIDIGDMVEIEKASKKNKKK